MLILVFLAVPILIRRTHNRHLHCPPHIPINIRFSNAYKVGKDILSFVEVLEIANEKGFEAGPLIYSQGMDFAWTTKQTFVNIAGNDCRTWESGMVHCTFLTKHLTGKKKEHEKDCSL